VPNLTALATLAALLFYAALSVPISRARSRSGVKAPNMVGDPGLERALRVQGNTLEWMPIFLPALWLAAFYVSDAAAAGLAVIWILGRVVYARGYLEAAEKRGAGFFIQLAAAAALWITALGGIVRALISG
jgi:glutathione S-transferase